MAKRGKTIGFRNELFRQGNHRCHYCDYPLINETDPCQYITLPNTTKKRPLIYLQLPPVGFDYATVDHVIPLHSNGANKLHNTVLACATCNQLKGKMQPTQFAKNHLRKPGYRMKIHAARINRFKDIWNKNVAIWEERKAADKRVPPFEEFPYETPFVVVEAA